MSDIDTCQAAESWMQARGWQPFAFQREVWQAMQQGRSGLLHATTGAGKTLAVWLGALEALIHKEKKHPGQEKCAGAATKNIVNNRLADKNRAPPLTVLWLTPMRALAADSLRALNEPLPALAPDWSSGLRTGDTTSGERAAQNKRLPTLLVTTPESLSLMLSRADAHDALKSVQLVVVDEWHELIGNKRGVQTQLALARLARWNTRLMIWGMSATLGNLPEALQTLLPISLQAKRPKPVLVQGKLDKSLLIDTLLPINAERFTWSGHMGLQMLPQVVQAIEESASTLVFTNTRSQTERWYQALLDARPDWAGQIALHHGSLSGEVRNWVEAGLKNGALKAVVCTSSLDLGVDFLPVERVLQIGSAKGVARLLQRAGRSGHAPGRTSRITLVPTHTLELVEAAAVRSAAQAGLVEARHAPQAPLDVLVQHLVTIALGGGFTPDDLLTEIQQTNSYQNLSAQAWQWALNFVRHGGDSLESYPDFQRVEVDEDGIWRMPNARLARRHRSNIGTIVSDASMSVQYLSGGKLGRVEESFVTRLKNGDVFMFAGKLLELVRIENMTAWVRKASKGSAALPRWTGGRMAISDALAAAILRQLHQAEQGRFNNAELQTARPLLQLQAAWSHIPTPGLLLAEVWQSREGQHLFLYPFAGRLVHIGLAGLLAWRAAQIDSNTFSISVNDYGFELLSAKPFDWARHLPGLLQMPAGGRDELLQQILASLNASEMAKRRFREIARIAGLIFQSHPGERRSNRQLQASASLYYDVFQKYDPNNQLLVQAQEEVLQQELDLSRLENALSNMQRQTLQVQTLQRPTPLAFPLMVERFREKLTTETLSDRLERMVADLEKSANSPEPAIPSSAGRKRMRKAA